MRAVDGYRPMTSRGSLTGLSMAESKKDKVYIDNEVEALRRVVVRRPGREIERMTQHDLERLLFDDILSPTETGREHDIMVEILRGGGAEIVEIGDLLTQAIASKKSERVGLLKDKESIDGRAREIRLKLKQLEKLKEKADAGNSYAQQVLHRIRHSLPLVGRIEHE